VAGRSLHILLAEDNEINQMVACGILNQSGHTVKVAQNGTEVAPLLAAHKFDVVLMDIQMPVMDGFQATAAIRESEKQTGAHMPVIAMTAHAMAGYKEKCLTAGMDGYVTKPVRHDLLLAALEECVKGEERVKGEDCVKDEETPADAGAPMPSAGSPIEAQFNRDDLVERLMGNRQLAQRVAGGFMDNMPAQLAALASAIEGNDAPAARLAAHSLKGAAANIGCADVQNLASRIERLGESGVLTEASEALTEFTAAYEAVRPAIERFCSEN
jgi:CheY-like chemotaxis protein/HPt (histidine-containing phosphotransfer) domain-containing protein